MAINCRWAPLQDPAQSYDACRRSPRSASLFLEARKQRNSPAPGKTPDRTGATPAGWRADGLVKEPNVSKSGRCASGDVWHDICSFINELPGERPAYRPKQ